MDLLQSLEGIDYRIDNRVAATLSTLQYNIIDANRSEVGAIDRLSPSPK